MTNDPTPGQDPAPRIVQLLMRNGRAAWRLVGILVAVGLLGWVFAQVKLILLAVFVALVHAALVTPLARWLESRGLGRTAAAALGLLAVVLVGGSATTLTGYRLVQQAPEVAEQVRERRDALLPLLQREPLSLTEAEVNELLDRGVEQMSATAGSGTDGEASRSEGDGDQAAEGDGQGPSPSTTLALLRGSATALRYLGFGLVGIVLAFFLVRDRDAITEGAVRHLAGGEHDARARQVLRAGWHALYGYVRASAAVGAVEAAAIGLTLLVVGTPLAASLTVLTFLAAFVPVAGATAAGVLAVLMTWIGVGVPQAVAVGVVVIVVQQFDSHVLQPTLVAAHTRLHPIATILALLVGGLVGGVLGALLAVPTAAVLVAVAAELLDPTEPEPAVATAS